MNIEERLSEKIQSMSREEFEKLCIDLLEKMGFKISTVKSVGGDIQVEASIERDGEKKDYVVKCSRREDIEDEVKNLEEITDENIHGFILTHKRVNKRIDSTVEVAGVKNLYKLLDKFNLLKGLDLEEEKIKRDQINKMMSEARNLLKNDEPRETIDKIIEIIKKDDKLKESWFLLSKAYDKIESYDNEIDALEQALEIDKRYLEAWRNKGEVHYKKSDYDEAIKCFEKVLEIEPESPETWNNIGLCYMKKGELDQALKSLDNALSLDESFTKALMNKALIFEKQGKINKTTKVSEKLIEIEPDNPEYQYINAAYLYKKDEYEKSLESINRVLDIDPDNKEARQLKDILDQQIKIERTDEMIKKNVEKSKYSDPIKQRRISEILWKLDDNEEAMKFVNEDDVITGCIFYERENVDKSKDIFKKNKEDIFSTINLEEIRYKNKDNIESKKLLENLKSENLPFKEKRLLTLIQLDHDKEVEDLFKNISDKDERLIDIIEERFRYIIRNKGSIEEIKKELKVTEENRILNLLSILHFVNHKNEESIDLLNKVTDVENPIYFNNLGCILFKMGEFKDSLKSFERTVEKNGKNPVYLNNYGFCLIEEDEINKALENLEKSLSIDEENYVSWYFKGIALKRDDDNNWKKSIQKTLEINPNFKKAEKMLE